MKRRYFYTVTRNGCNSCDFNTLAEAQAYKEDYRQEDGSYAYKVVKSNGETIVVKVDIVITKHWELVNE